MNDKSILLENIRKWVKIENEIKNLKKEQNTRKKIQKEISSEIMDVMKKNEIDEFTIKNGKLVYSKQNVKKPITKKYLFDILSKYFDDEDKAGEVNTFIHENRETHEVESIKFKNSS